MKLDDVLQLNTEAVDVLSYEPACDFSTIAIPLFCEAIDPIARSLADGCDDEMKENLTLTSNDDTIDFELEIVESLGSHQQGLPDQSSFRLYDAALHLNLSNDSLPSSLERDIHKIQPSKREVLFAVILYNTALTHHLIGLTDMHNQTKELRNAMDLYKVLLSVLLKESKIKAEISDFLLLAVTTNMTHIHAVWFDQDQTRKHLLQARILVHHMQVSGNKYFFSNELLAQCFCSNLLLKIPGEQFAPAA